MGYFEKYNDKGGKPRFRLKSGNHQVILSSEGYSSASSRDNGIASVQKNSGDRKRYETRTTSSGKPYFVLKAGNGEVIGSSQAYASSSGCSKGIKCVMKNGSTKKMKEV